MKCIVESFYTHYKPPTNRGAYFRFVKKGEQALVWETPWRDTSIVRGQHPRNLGAFPNLFNEMGSPKLDQIQLKLVF